MPKRTVAKKNWTIMVYLAGDNNLDSAGAVDLKEMKQVGSNDQINVLAQFDRAGTIRKKADHFSTVPPCLHSH